MWPEKRLEVAEALLSKARSTTYAAERLVFAKGALDQIDAFLRARADGRPVIDLRDGVVHRYDEAPEPAPGRVVDLDL